MKKRKKEIKVSGETKNLFCPSCNSLLVIDPETGLRKCNRCKKYWQYAGKKISVTEERRVRPGKMIADEK